MASNSESVDLEKSSQDEPGVAMKKKNNQGDHECEVLGPGPEAAESARAWRRCTKNPGHGKFIPVSEFSLDHLPPRYQKDEILNDIRAQCDVTVRLTVNYITEMRPDGFAFSDFRGFNVPHQGTGYVIDVVPGDGPCQCRACAQSSSTYMEWDMILMVTACHVVFNSEEVKATTVDFLYDDEASMKDGTMKTESGTFAIYEDEMWDKCIFMCATHDQDLAKRLRNARRVLDIRRVDENDDIGDLSELGHCEDCTVVVVSHPHGQPKKVTVGGSVIVRDVLSGIRCKRYDYKTDTCPGSSGAPVSVLLPDLCSFHDFIQHSGSLTSKKVNHSVLCKLSYDSH